MGEIRYVKCVYPDRRTCTRECQPETRVQDGTMVRQEGRWRRMLCGISFGSASKPGLPRRSQYLALSGLVSASPAHSICLVVFVIHKLPTSRRKSGHRSLAWHVIGEPASDFCDATRCWISAADRKIKLWISSPCLDRFRALLVTDLNYIVADIENQATMVLLTIDRVSGAWGCSASW